MNAQHSPDLHELLQDAVSEIEPERSVESLMTRLDDESGRRRPWLVVSGGAVLVAAATVAVVASLGGSPATHRSGPGFAEAPSPSAHVSPSGPVSASPSTADQSPSGDVSTTAAEPAPTHPAALPVYYVGSTARGAGLYREFHRQQIQQGALLDESVAQAVSGAPQDPDYRSAWPAGTTVRSTGFQDGVITVDLHATDGSLTVRPAGMSQQVAAAAVQQVVYTAEAALQQGRPPVRFLVDGQPVDTVLGEPAVDPVPAGDPLETLSHLSITSPQEGATVSGSVKVTGVANSFEANVVCSVLNGGHAYGDNPFTASGYLGDRLFPFSGTIDVSGIPPGSYTLACMTDDPSGGAEGHGPDSDTRTITIR